MSDVTLQSLIQDQDYIIKDEFVDMYEYDRDSPDRLHEIADGNVPVYYADRASVLASEPGLEIQDKGLIGNNSSIMDLIGIAIYEELINAAHAEYNQLKDQFEELRDDAESEGFSCEKIPGKGYCIVEGEEPDEGCDDVREFHVTDESSETAAWVEFFKKQGDW